MGRLEWLRWEQKMSRGLGNAAAIGLGNAAGIDLEIIKLLLSPKVNLHQKWDEGEGSLSRLVFTRYDIWVDSP